MSVKVKTFGVSEILGKMETLRLVSNPDVKKLLKKMGSKVRDDTKKRTPVDSGALRKSWHFKTIGNFAVKITSDKDYAPFVEEGTKTGAGAFKPGKLMLKKSVDDMRYIYLGGLVDDFYKSLKRKYER